jgi:hypothetical protein
MSLRLKELGFTPKTYVRSKLYSIVKARVLERDVGTCRKKGCIHPATKLGYVELDLKTLAGHCNLLFSLCADCYETSLIKKPPKSERLSLDRVFNMVSGLRKIEKRSDRKIGDWYRAQLSNDLNTAYNELIRDDLQSLSPEDWECVKEYWL